MHFIHEPYQPEETIAAIATPPGVGGVGIIRISGRHAVSIAAKSTNCPVHTYLSHTAHFGHVVDNQGNKVDDVLILPMLGKRSYTGEDTVEIHCHGGSLITRRVLEIVLAQGARLAMPGEFTFKAFINGKMDLIQAEAVQSLIHAKNEYALECAKNQLHGSLSQKVQQFQKELNLIAAILEAWVDFPEEGLEFASMEDVIASLSTCAQEMEKLVKTFHNGKVIHEGMTLCLVGAPNVGKSSLMNALLDKERAIVSPIPGTTRDVLEDHLRLNGLHFRILDTAGVRDADEVIEKEGIRRSKEAMNQADLVLLVLDAYKGIDRDDQHLLDSVPLEKTIVIWNKTDLADPPSSSYPHTVVLSAKTKSGLEKLHQTIDSLVWKGGPPSKEEIVITNARHKECLTLSIEACHRLIDGLKKGVSPEFLSIDMRECLTNLAKIVGANITEDILSAIFSTFCVGK